MIHRLQRIVYYILFFVTPFVMLGITSELFEFNKMIFIYSIALATGGLFVYRSFTERKISLPRTPLDPFIGLFLLSQILSAFFSIDPHTSLFGYYGRFNGGLFSIIAYIVLFYGFIDTAGGREGKEFLKRLLTGLLVVSSVVVLWGLPGKFLGADLSCAVFTREFNNNCWTASFDPAVRMFSTLGQPNWLGAYLAATFFIGMYFYLRELFAKKFTWNRANLLLTGYLLLSFCGVLFTRSRSALIAVTVGLSVVLGHFTLILWHRAGSGEVKRLASRLVPLFVLFLAAVLVFKTGSEAVDRYLPFGAQKQTAQTVRPVEESSEITESFDIRKIVWEGAVELGKRYPLFGTGVETFAYSYYETRPASHNLTSEWDFLYNKAHNEYLNYLATTGFVGFISYLALIASVIYLLVKELLSYKTDKQGKAQMKELTAERKLFTVSVLGAYSTILVTNFFGFSTTTIQLFFWLLPALAIVTLGRGSAKVIKLPVMRPLYSYTIAGVLIAVLAYKVIFLVNYVRADIAYNSGKSATRVAEYNSAFVDYKKALSLHYEHVYEDAYSYNLANLAFLASYTKDATLAAELMELSREYNSRALSAAPRNVIYFKTTAKNQYLFFQITEDKKDLERGVTALKAASELAPTDPKLPYTEAVFFSILEEVDAPNRGKHQEESIKLLDKAIALKKDYRDAYFLKAQLLKRYGRPAEARTLLEFILKEISPLDPDIMQELGTP